MKTISFDIGGAYGHFRKPYAPVSPVTYPFPPPPTILGMVGAILGYDKEEYLERIGWDKVKVAVKLKNPIKKYRTALNLINTKDNKYFRLKSENPHIQIPYEFLKDPAFRIWIADANDQTMIDLESLLLQGRTIYTPCLGLAQCVAQVTFITVQNASSLDCDIHNISSVVSWDVDSCKFEPEKRYVRYRVAAKMRPDRVVEDYREVIVEEQAGIIAVNTAQAYKVGDEKILFF